MSLKSITQQAFADTFGYQASHSIQAPSCVNLIGEHTDYNDSFVLPCAIDYQTVIACAKRDDRQMRVVAVDYDNQQDIFSLYAPIEPLDESMWANYCARRGETSAEARCQFRRRRYGDQR